MHYRSEPGARSLKTSSTDLFEDYKTRIDLLSLCNHLFQIQIHISIINAKFLQ